MVAVAAEGPIRGADAVQATAAAGEAVRAADAAKGGDAPAKEEVKEYASDMRKLEELLSKLNPSAEEFVPLSRRRGDGRQLSADAPVFVCRRNGPFHQGKRRIMGGRPRRANREDSVRRTVYVSDIDQHVTEQKLAEVFSTCGQVVDCRICGDPNSVLRFAFIEFADDVGARAALALGGTVLGFYPVKVLPSKTAILPVNPKFLPRTEDEKEMVSRTVYCTNIDKKVSEDEVRQFFEGSCGKVARLRLLGDYVHSTCIAFVEFVQADSAILALNCSGMILGTLQGEPFKDSSSPPFAP
ncbi:hypothetical protein PR202_ga15226 [Eleusine coracana subsp. coracana]|uniref:RRM domain-containing protein n=1 Tax=Eleusine coracana subsp. coracana TaxID=191504 RepID=A0AAV5CJN9_ELECO|nr:hypothetical protein PR202_ga15226 [Eleusine coracana subsp. coracana]